jgi:hypothetical protein
MRELDLNAPIVPGVSAAGFTIGDTLSEMEQILSIAKPIDLKTKVNFNKELANSQGWVITSSVMEEAHGHETSLYYKDRCVILGFSCTGILYSIYVGYGYQGILFDGISIGSPLSEVSRILTLCYDDGDEMHYPSEEMTVEGVAFYASEMPLEEDPAQTIVMICIHDWKLSVG